MRRTIALIGLLGCGGKDEGSEGGAPKGDGAEIEVDRESIDFGSLEGAESRTEILEIRNAGSSDLTVVATVEGDGAFTITEAPPAAIPPMTTERMTVTFQPVFGGEADARLVLAT